MCDIECSILNMFTHEMEVGADVSAPTMEVGFPCNGDGGSVVQEEFCGGRVTTIEHADIAH